MLRVRRHHSITTGEIEMKTQRWSASSAMRGTLLAVGVLMTGATGALAQNQGNEPASCSLSQSVVNNVLGQLSSVVNLNNGGLFSPNKMWAAVVDREGVLCKVVSSSSDAWPGSRDIAIAKA